VIFVAQKPYQPRILDILLQDARQSSPDGLLRDFSTFVMQPPSFLMVLTGNGYALKRPDSVVVVPITCLRH